MSSGGIALIGISNSSNRKNKNKNRIKNKKSRESETKKIKDKFPCLSHMDFFPRESDRKYLGNYCRGIFVIRYYASIGVWK